MVRYREEDEDDDEVKMKMKKKNIKNWYKIGALGAYLIFVTNITNVVCGEKICHVEKIFHMTNCHAEKFLHMTNIQLETCLYMVNKEKNHVMWRNVE